MLARRAGPTTLTVHAMDSPQEELRRRLFALGFDDVRFASVAVPVRGALPEWLARGMQGEMQWMERSAAKRLDPQQVLPGARSIIMLGVNYWPGGRHVPPVETTATWARYALYEDYHDTMKPALVAAGRALEQLYGAGERDHRYYVTPARCSNAVGRRAPDSVSPARTRC